MIKLLSFSILIILFTQISFSQKNQLRSLNEVVFSFYKPWDEEQKKTKIPAPLLHDDIDSFVKAIEEIGVNPYLNFPKDSFYLEISLLKSKIDKPLTRREFLQLFVPICNDLKLSHTFINSELWFDKNAFDKNGGIYFPISITIEKNRLFVDKDYSPLQLTKGDEIIALNYIKSKKIIDSLLRYPNSSTMHSKVLDVQNNFSVWLWWVYNFRDTFKLETNKNIYTIKGLTSVELEKVKNENSVQQTEKEYKQYEYKQIDSKTGKLIFNDFNIRDSTVYYSFLDSVFLQIKANSIQNLIIDIRGNSGGNERSVEVVKYLYDKPFRADSKRYYKKSKAAEDFFRLFLHAEDTNDVSMLKFVNESIFGKCQAEHEYGESYECGNEFVYSPKPDSIRFKGNLFVLTDYNTNSAAVDFVVLIKDYQIGTIIGNETMQSPSNDANGGYFVLSNSNTMAQIANIYEIRPNGDPGTTRGVIPDYEVTQNNSDTEKGIDTIMEFTLELIKSKN